MKNIVTAGLKVLCLVTLGVGAIAPSRSLAQAARNSTYEVPTSAMLDEALTVDLKKARLNLRKDSASLDYRLPAELDGTNAKRFYLTGTFDGSNWNLSTNDQVNSNGDPAAKATCQGNERDFNCTMQYGKNDQGVFTLDTAAADSYLQTRPDLTPADIAHIKAAQTALSHEPIGIIRVRR
jgi:hypothetical protein